MNHILRIVGTSELPEPLEMGQDYTIELKTSVDGKSEKDNHDGEHTITYMARIIEGIVLEKLGKSIMLSSRKEKTPAQRLRNVFWKIWSGLENGQDFDSYYEEEMEKIIEKQKERIV